MLISKTKIITMVVLAAGLVALGATTLHSRATGGDERPDLDQFAAALNSKDDAPDEDKAKEKVNLQLSDNHLKNIGVALHTYQGAFETLPAPALSDKDGKPLLSWRVALLPFLSEEALDKQFKLDEPWDSEHNKKLLDKMPQLYATRTAKGTDKYRTYFKVFVGKSAAFEPNRKFQFKDFRKGPANTVLVIEAGDPVPWTKPEDIPFDLQKPLPKLDGPFKNVVNVVMADGHTVAIPRDMAEKKLRSAITRDRDD
jgi:hypothetical protein